MVVLGNFNFMKETENKNQLLAELNTLRKRVAELERREAERINTCEGEEKKRRILSELFNATEEITFLQELDGTILIANDNSRLFTKFRKTTS